jgi:hypothetical protein
MDNNQHSGIELRRQRCAKLLQGSYSAGGSPDHDQVPVWHWTTSELVGWPVRMQGFLDQRK